LLDDSYGSSNNNDSSDQANDYVNKHVKAAGSKAGYNVDDNTANRIGDGLTETFKKLGGGSF